MKRFLIIFILLVATTGCRSEKKPVEPASIWIKGNTHMHSTLSDGDVLPEKALGWYNDHGYGFAVLTDHHKLAAPGVIDKCTNEKFIAIQGEELSTDQGDANFAIHLNAIGVSQVLTPIPDPSKTAMLKLNYDLISNSGSIVQLNHPNFNFMNPEAIRGLTGKFLIEVFNNSVANEKGIARMAQMIFEQAWDDALSAGLTAYAVASDDTHNYTVIKLGNSNPGGGWIMVRVPKLGREEILKSIRDGDFYASTGVLIDSTSYKDGILSVSVKPEAGRQYAISFIGKGGKVLSKQSGAKSEYKLTGIPDEAYVRVKVTADDKTAAWLQPIRPVGK